MEVGAGRALADMPAALAGHLLYPSNGGLLPHPITNSAPVGLQWMDVQLTLGVEGGCAPFGSVGSVAPWPFRAPTEVTVSLAVSAAERPGSHRHRRQTGIVTAVTVSPALSTAKRPGSHRHRRQTGIVPAASKRRWGIALFAAMRLVEIAWLRDHSEPLCGVFGGHSARSCQLPIGLAAIATVGGQGSHLLQVVTG
eukprot:s3041_g2.t1